MTFFSKLTNKSGPIYPWSQKKLNITNPFPRVGHSASQSARDNDIFIFGGVAKGRARNDVYLLEANTLNVQAISTTGDIPPPRSRHTHVIIGQQMIVFGGLVANPEENPDDNIFILNIETKSWIQPTIIGNHPIARYGHAATTVGTKMYIFGGEAEGYYMNDLLALDAASMNSGEARWEVVVSANDPPSGRSGHVAVTFNEKIYIFGGTDGKRRYNDTWCYDIRSNTWTELVCIGYIPLPRDSHGATLVGDVLYVFGGKGPEGEELGDLAAFRITNKRWYMFQKMGPSPYPRHTTVLSACREKIFVLGGDSLHRAKPDESGSSGDSLRGPPSPTQTFPRSQSLADSRSNSLTNDAQRYQRTPYGDPIPYGANDPRFQGPPRQGSPKTGPEGMIYTNQMYGGQQANGTGQGSPRGQTFPKRQMTGNNIAPRGPEGQMISRGMSPDNTRNDGTLPNARNSPTEQFRYMESTPTTPPGSAQAPFGRKQSIESLRKQTPSPQGSRQQRSVDNLREANGFRSPRSGPEKTAAEYGPKDFTNPRAAPRPPQGGVRVNNVGMQNNNMGGQVGMGMQNNNMGGQVGMGMQNNTNIGGQSGVGMQNYNMGVQGGLSLQSNNIGNQGGVSMNPPPAQSQGSFTGVNQNADTNTQQLIVNTNKAQGSVLYGGTFSPGTSSGSPTTIRSPMSPTETMKLADQFPTPVSNAERDSFLRELQQRDAAISLLKKRENWFRTELAFARKAGFSPDFSRDADMSEDSEEQLLNVGEPNSDKYKLIVALMKVKQELRRAKATIASQAQTASLKITESERIRTAALQEAAYFKAKLTALVNASETDLAQIESQRAAELEKRLTQALTEKESSQAKLIQYQQSSSYEIQARESAEERAKAANARAEEMEESHARVLTELATLHSRATAAETSLRQANTRLAETNAELAQHRVKSSGSQGQLTQLQLSLDQHQRALEKANTALGAANERASEAESLWRQARQDRQDIVSLEKEAAGLRAELDVKMRDLDRAYAKTDELERLLATAQKEADAVRAVMQESMTELLNTSRSGTNDLNTSDLTRRYNELEQEVEKLKIARSDSQTAADEASRSLAEAMGRTSHLEATNIKSRSENASLQRRLAEATDEIARLKDKIREKERELETKTQVLEEADVKIGMMRDVMSEKGILDNGGTSSMAIRYKELEARYAELGFVHAETSNQLSEARAKLKQRLQQVESDYQTAVHYVKGSEKMLRRMKEELTRSQTENGRINEKLLQMQERSEDLEEKLADAENQMTVRRGARESRIQEYANARLEEQRKDFDKEKQALQQQLTDIQVQLERSNNDKAMMDQEYEVLRKEYETLKNLHAQTTQQLDNLGAELKRAQEVLQATRTELEETLNLNEHLNRELDNALNGSPRKENGLQDTTRHSMERQQWDEHRTLLEREIGEYRTKTETLEKENVELNHKIGILLDQMEHAVDTYRGIEVNIRDNSPRNSGALDSIANELDALKSQWDETQKNVDVSVDDRWSRLPENNNDNVRVPSRLEEYDDMIKALDEVHKSAATRNLVPMSPNSSQNSQAMSNGSGLIDHIRSQLSLTPPPTPPGPSP
ncbi:1565_t:CDS:2 [Paraglomus brasilianum]|uniref:1565_t:CDS:1 n=1 Tax=Paraglomus brasilianum TaxID=144538 RepID=A0A9N9EZN9_9GLOM|nr:1565_t:CDS:2 [Paraglomus brasilianum]